MQPTIRSEQDIYNSLAGVYDPQTQLINQQVSQVDVDAQAQQASLDQAKVNAFKDIDLSANRKGMLFSGFSPDQQAGYLGTKYLPAVANLKSSSINAKNTLTAQLNKLSADRRTQAIQGVTADTKAYNDFVKQQGLDTYRQAQLGLGYARLAQSGASAAAKPASAGEILSYWTKADASEVGGGGKYNNSVANYHRWAKAEAELSAAGYDPNKYKGQLATLFGTAADRYKYAPTQSSNAKKK